MLALLNVVLTQAVLDIVTFISETQRTTAVHAMPLAMREMTAVQMHSNFANVSVYTLINLSLTYLCYSTTIIDKFSHYVISIHGHI